MYHVGSTRLPLLHTVCAKQAAACIVQIGLLAALPMVAAKSWSWTDYARERFPDMDQLQRNRMDDLQPLLASMSLSQVPCACVLRVMLSLQATCHMECALYTKTFMPGAQQSPVNVSTTA